MTFITVEFWIFLAVVAVVCFALPFRFRRLFLLAASYLFYLFGGLGNLLLLVVATLVNYGVGLWLARAERRRGLVLALSLVFNLGLLVVFKYFNFFNDSFAALFERFNLPYQVAALDLALPLGISFYTFQLIAYVVDIYRRKIGPERSLGIFAAYVAFFPKIVAGPIERPGHLLPQFRRRVDFDDARVVEGLRRILWGVFKKVVIADRLAIYVNEVYSQPEGHAGLPLLVATVFFTFQIYCDFSAYSDIAIGVARVLGFDLTENFRQPYLSRSIREFWRRWHITLSSWFRDYLYFPLGGSRVPLGRALFNLMLVFVVSGLWHGASWTFVVWGALHGGYIVVETLWDRRPALRTPRLNPRLAGLMKTLLTFTLVAFAWIFFRANSVDDAGFIVAHLFDFTDGTGDVTGPFKDALFPQEIEFRLAFALIALLIVADWIDARWGIVAALGRGPAPVRWAVYYTLALSIGISAWIYVTSTQNFIYARF